MVSIFTAYLQGYQGISRSVLNGNIHYADSHIGYRGGNVGKHSDSVIRLYLQICLEQTVLRVGRYIPRCAYPSIRIIGIAFSKRYVGAIRLMNGYAVSLCYKADNAIPGQRIAALRKFHGAAAFSVDYYSAVGFDVLWL